MGPTLISDAAYVCRLDTDTPATMRLSAPATVRVACRHALDMVTGMPGDRAADANPATGPIAVDGAQPGQALRVDVLRIHCRSPGHVAADWHGGLQEVAIQDDQVHFHGHTVPLFPMIGTIGVAPATGSWSTQDAGPWGGNMDIRDVAPGASLYLPVQRPDGHLVLGDVHAAMGDGEIGGQGLEVAATVDLRLSVEPAPMSPGIHLVRAGRVMTVGAAATLEEAIEQATRAMIQLVVAHGNMDAFHARKFLGLAADTLIGQHCCPVKTVRVALDLEHLPGLERRRPR